jgi:glycosyltransferase involved in cell wall biosynthesis
MRVLHICTNFLGSQLYVQLFSGLDALGVQQVVYSPVRQSSGKSDRHISFAQNDSKVVVRNLLNFSTRASYRFKINKVVRDVIQHGLMDGVDVIHAHTWYSDGGVAYELWRKFGIPYIIAVRNTDINIFDRFMWHIRSYGLEIFDSASRIVFINRVYRERLLSSHRFADYHALIERKSVLLPNGIDDYWLNSSFVRRALDPLDEIVLIYVGSFSRSKNVLRLTKAVHLLSSQGLKCHLHLVGTGGTQQRAVEKFVSGKLCFTYHGQVDRKEQLLQLYRASHIFVMPSLNETFGLVYIEALSQGIPVLYTRNEGIDGMYELIGEPVDANSTRSIMDGILKIITNYPSYVVHPQAILCNHRWQDIAQRYLSLYHSCIR